MLCRRRALCIIYVVYHFHLGSHVERKQTQQFGLCSPVNRSPDPALDVGSTATIPKFPRRKQRSWTGIPLAAPRSKRIPKHSPISRAVRRFLRLMSCCCEPESAADEAGTEEALPGPSGGWGGSGRNSPAGGAAART